MDIEKLQLKLRQFAKERDWEQFHSPKNLAMALSVEAAELLEIFQWSNSGGADEIKDPKKAVDRAVEWSVSRGEFEKPIGRIDDKEYKTPEKFFKSKDWKGAGNYILKGTIFQIDAQGNATKIEQYYESKGSSKFSIPGFGKDE